MGELLDKISHCELSSYEVIGIIKKEKWSDIVIERLLDDILGEALIFGWNPKTIYISEQLKETAKEIASVCLPKYGRIKKLKQAAEPQQVAMKHYNSKDEEAKLKRLFEELKKEGYFDKKADVETWLYICGINDKIIPQKPLNWISDNGLLAHLIKALFLQDYNKWSIASKCFTVKGETPKPNVLSKLDSVGFHMKNKRHQRLDEILKSCGL